jgi:kinesin family protein 5
LILLLDCQNTDFPHRFEVQLTAVKERLEAAKAGSTRGLGSENTASFAFGGAGSRIAKPLRGGGGTAGHEGVGALPTLASLQGGENGASAGKRSSWFFNQRT